MAEGKEECAAQFSGLEGKHSQVFKPQHLVQTRVWPGHWCGERGWLCTYCWPEAPWVIIVWVGVPWSPQSSPKSQAAPSVLSGAASPPRAQY